MSFLWGSNPRFLAILAAAFFVMAPVASPAHADRGAAQSGKHPRVSVPGTHRHGSRPALANGLAGGSGQGTFRAWGPSLGEGAVSPARAYRLKVNRGLAIPGSAFSNQHLGGASLSLHNGTGVLPQSLTLLAGALPADRPGESGYTTGLAWQSDYRDNDNLGFSVVYSKGSGFGNSGQWLSTVHSQIVPVPELTGITVEAELAAVKALSRRAVRTDPVGARMRLAGPAGGPFQYNVTLARYGNGFRPLGSVVATDWKGVSADASYRFSSHMQLKAHTDYGRQNFESNDPTIHRGASVALNGHVLKYLMPGWASAMRDALKSDAAGEHHPVLDTLRKMVMMLAQPMWGGWNYRLGMTLQDREDTLSNRERASRGFRLSGNQPLNLFGLDGSIGPGFAWHNYYGSPLQDSFEGGMALNLQEHAHKLAFDVGYFSQGWANPDNNQRAMKFRLNYSFTFGAPATPVATISPAWYTPNGAGF